MKNQKLIFGNILLGIIISLFLNLYPVTEASSSSNARVETGSDNEQTLICELEATHVHTYTNISGPKDGTEYWARIKKFRIYLHDDLMSDIDLDSLECSSGGSWISCDGGTSTADGGTRVTFVQGDTSSDAVYENYVEWEYGRTTSGDSPIIPGYNDYDEDGDIDSSDESDRTMGEYLTFDFKDDITEGSATTTSSVYIKFWAYDIEDGTWTAVEEDGETDYHWNDDTVTNITNYTCDEGCNLLTLSPTSLSVTDLYSDTSLEVNAYNSDGDNINDDLTFHYTAEGYDGATAEGYFRDGRLPNFTNDGTDFETADPTIVYKSSGAGDSIRVEAVDYEDSCYAEIEFPYCSDLNFTRPAVINYGAEVSDDLEISPEASNGEDWPYDIVYSSSDSDSTFDDNTQPYTTTDWTVTYKSDESATVTIEAEDDVAGLCRAEYDYSLIATCESLEASPDTITARQMNAGEVEITWTSNMTNGVPATGPWLVLSSNSSSTIRSGASSGTGALLTSQDTVYYMGEPGDTITITDTSYATCGDTITSLPERELPICEDVELTGPILEADDSNCWDYAFNTSSSTFNGRIVAEGFTDNTESEYSGTLTLIDSGTGTTASGNPAYIDVTGSRIEGTVCWDGYSPGNYLSLDMLGEDLCNAFFELPEANYCVDLELSPDSVEIDYAGSDAGTVDLTVDITGASASWSGTLIILATGYGSNAAGTLYYADGTESEFLNGHLEIPVYGTSSTANATYVGGAESDQVKTWIVDEVDACEDIMYFTKEETPTTGGNNGGGGGGGGGGGSSSSSKICTDLEFDEETLEIGEDLELGEDYEATITIDSDLDHQTLVVNYGCADEGGYFTFEGEETKDADQIAIEDIDADDDSIEITFNNICLGADIYAYIENEDSCEDSVELELQEEIGTLDKYMFTFNFMVEKDAYSDEDIFFSHDEDFAFWTLEYSPTGTESSVTFEDTMWGGSSITGTLGDGSESEGSISLATPDEFSEFDDYSSIARLGLTEANEVGSSNVGDDAYGEGMLWMPYIKYYDGTYSESIPECADEDGDGSYDTNEVCYNPNHDPFNSGDVVIENVFKMPEDAVIRVRYVGKVQTTEGLCDSDVTNDECLTETFENTGSVTVDGETIEENAKLVALCPYLVTRNAGDVYLNEQLYTGTDIACIYNEDGSSDYANIEGIVVSGTSDDSTSNSSSSSTTSSTNSDFCDDTSDSSGFISNLSSYVCEIVSAVSSLWKVETITTTTESSVNAEVRNAATSQSSYSSSSFNSGDTAANWNNLYNALKNQNNEESGILYYSGNPDDADDYIELGSIEVPAGAWTLIVENADLHISGDITYASTSDYSNIPSIAFIVLGGDIFIENFVSELVGVYYTDQAFDGSDRSAVNQQLTIYGSLYGDLSLLLAAANYVGSPTEDGGSLVVNYDSRILINTPPGLSEYVDIYSEQSL